MSVSVVWYLCSSHITCVAAAAASSTSEVLSNLLWQELEDHYYSSKHRRPPDTDTADVGACRALTELYRTALDVAQA